LSSIVNLILYDCVLLVRINSQFAMATAMIGEDLEADTDLGQMSVSLFDESVDLNSTASSLTSQASVTQNCKSVR